MKPVNILVYGKNADILQTVLRLINKRDNWRGEGTADEEEVLTKCQQQAFDILLLGGGIPEVSEKKIRAIIGRLYPNLTIVQHYGGGSGLLYNEVEAALSKDAQFTLVDNPFG